MDFKSPLFVFIVMFVTMLAIGIFAVVIQVQLMNSSKVLLELVNNVSKLSHDTSTNVSELKTDMSRHVSELSNDMSKNVFELSTNTSELSENFSGFSKNFLKTFVNFKSYVLNTFDSHHDPSGLYSFGGVGASGSIISSASRLNTFTGEWERIKSMSIKKYDFCGAVMKNRIYLFGGYTPSGRTSQVEIYDTLTANYEQLQSMSDARFQCGAAALNGSIYVAGGYYTSELSSVIRYNIQTDQWASVSSMNYQRKAFQLVAFNKQLFAIAGDAKNSVEVYNATSNQWAMGASTKYQHKFFGAAVHEGKIYVCSHLRFEEYSPNTKIWSELTPLNNSTGRTLLSMNGKLWALGGGSSVFTYDTLTGNWTQQADLPVARRQHVSFVVNL